MNNHNNGISIIGLVITILVTVILAAVMIPSGIEHINGAKLASFNTDIMTLKQEAKSYYMLKREYPAKVDVSGKPIIYSMEISQSLLAEAAKKNDQNDIFYIVDLDKINISNKEIGVGKTIDDYYIIAKKSLNVYYAKGVTIGNNTYYTKENKTDGVIGIMPTSAPTPTSVLVATNTPVPTSTPTMTPTNSPTPTSASLVITVSNVWPSGSTSGKIGSTFGVSGKVQSNINGDTLTIFWTDNTNTPMFIQNVICDTTLQSFTGTARVTGTGTYTMKVWAQNSTGTIKSNEILITVTGSLT